MNRWQFVFVPLIATLSACLPFAGTSLAPTSGPTAAYTPPVAPAATPTLLPSPTPQLSPTPFSYEGVPLPDFCRPPSEDQPSPCQDFRFSPDGTYLGFLTASPSQGHIVILDVTTGEMLYPFGEGPLPGGHRVEFLPDGRVLLFEGHYEGGEIALLDLGERTRKALGSEGSIVWNPQRTAFAVMAIPHIAISSQVWGYNLEMDFTFKPSRWEDKYEVFPTWAPDGRHLLYAYRPFDGANVYAEPSRIMMVDAETGKIATVLFQSGYDFHICNPVQDDACPPQQGDWIPVRRVPFPLDPLPPDSALGINSCVYLGEGCPGEAIFLFNWRTGELRAADEP